MSTTTEQDANNAATLQEFWTIACEQIAEACELLGMDRSEAPLDGWTLRERIHRLMVGAINNGRVLYPGKDAWYGVSQVLGVGSTTAARICVANQLDPQTGKPIE